MNDPVPFLPRPSSPLPVEYDFDPHGSRAAQSSWECFGGLTIRQAYEKLSDDPENVEAEFAHMGRAAFDYYFPVIDRYLRSADPKDHNDHREARALAYTLAAQLTGDLEPRLAQELEDLTDFVLGNIRYFAHNRTGERKIGGAWKLVRKKLRRGGA
ncbi:MAG: hypothetical protein AAF488_09395 [Planctomycetota bacterium]